MGHHDPVRSGALLVRHWAEQDQWQRQVDTYKDRVEKERASDPTKISSDIDGLCVKMQRVVENYIGQFFDPATSQVEIPTNFKSRDFADMAAALRMIHETRIKIRKAITPQTPEGKEGKKKDILNLIREAGLARLRDNRQRRQPTPASEEEPSHELSGDEPGHRPESDAPEADLRLPSLADLRAQLEAAYGQTGEDSDALGSLEADPFAERE